MQSLSFFCWSGTTPSQMTKRQMMLKVQYQNIRLFYWYLLIIQRICALHALLFSSFFVCFLPFSLLHMTQLRMCSLLRSCFTLFLIKACLVDSAILLSQ